MWQLLIPTIAQIIDKIIPDKEAAAAANLEILKLAQGGQFKELETLAELARQQTSVNALEAQQGTFRGGWRPAVGWVCASGLAYQFLARPVLPWIATVAGFDVPPLPPLQTEELYPLLMGILGLGGLRTLERVKDKA